jgi:hypothetical protein
MWEFAAGISALRNRSDFVRVMKLATESTLMKVGRVQASRLDRHVSSGLWMSRHRCAPTAVPLAVR